MNNPLQYELGFIEVLSSLANINPQVIIYKNPETNQLHVSNNTRNTKIYYIVDADASKFNFSGKNFAILSFPKFKQYFSSCLVSDKTKLPILETINDSDGEPVTVCMKQPVINMELQHALASIEGIIKPALYDAATDSYDTICEDEASAKFELAADQLSFIQKMVGTIGATSVKFSVNNGICTITLFNPKTSDVFSQNYPVETAEGVTKFDVTVTSDSLAYLPNSKYNLIIDKEGLLHFEEIRDDGIKVNLFLAAEEV